MDVTMVSNELPMEINGDFPYRTLRPDRGEIRLIHLDTFNMRDSEAEPAVPGTVCCSLQYAFLEDRPQYTALSYTWGDQSIRTDILLDGRRVPVTKNLESALRHLLLEQQSGLATGPTPLWVDAVCIDQQNQAERSQQVSQMGRIFETAAKTVVWLGAESRDSDLAIDTLRKLSASARNIIPCVQSWSEFPFDDAKGNPVARAVLSELDEFLVDLRRDDSAKLKAVTRLYERSWFRRVWVIQERVLSRKCIVYCGKARILWYDFYQGFWLLCGLRDYLNLTSTGHQDSSALAASLTAALDRVVPAVFTSSGLSLLQLLSLLSSMAPAARLQASDQRDYIYALLGLVHSRHSPGISIDYTKAWATVRAEVGQACLAHYGPYMLSFAGSCFRTDAAENVVEGAPSWAPDWSSRYLPQPLYVPSIFVVRGRTRRCPYSAARSSIQDLSQGFTATGRLGLTAFYVDEIAHLGRPFSEDEDPADDTARVTALSSWLHDLQAMLPCVSEVYRTTEDVGDALWKTPIVDRAYVHAWETARASEKTYMSYQAVRADNVAEGVRYTNIAYNKLFGRRPFRSAKGLLGLGPLGAREGDKIWLLPGADVPFVFRRAGDSTFTVIGEAYVHGVMDGELFQPSLGLQNITLV